MFAQAMLPLRRPARPRVRSNRRVFQPRPPAPNTYRFPHDVRDRLVSSLAPFRNREAAFALAVFLARFWSMPGRVAGSFPIDRRALAEHAGLDLTEARVRGAIRTLEAVGFLARAIPAPGSRYRVTEDGLQRRPVLFVFGAEYAPAFIAANARAAAARGRRSGERRALGAVPAPAAVREPESGLAELAHKQERSGSLGDYGRVKKQLAAPTLRALRPAGGFLEPTRERHPESEGDHDKRREGCRGAGSTASSGRVRFVRRT